MKFLAASVLYAAALVSAATIPAAPDAAAPGREANYTTGDWIDTPTEQVPYPPAPVPGPWRAINWTGVSRPDFVGETSPIEDYPYADMFTPASPAHMSADYARSKVGFFSLDSLAVGCAQAQSFASGRYNFSAPVNCTLQIDGYRGPVVGKPAVSKTIAYKAVIDRYFAGYPQARPSTYTFGREFAVLRNIVFTPKLGANPSSGVPLGPVTAYWSNVMYHVTNSTV